MIPGNVSDSFALSESVNILRMEGGGHCGFLGRRQPDEDRYWVENRALEIVNGQRAPSSSEEFAP